MTAEELLALLKVIAGLEMSVQFHAAEVARLRAEVESLRLELSSPQKIKETE